MQHFDVAIVGTGHGGAQAAISLRQAGFAGSIALIGREDALPYERPPLSKEYLAGEKPRERLLIRPQAFWQERQIQLLLGNAARHIEARTHRLTLADGTLVEYGQLIWAGGGHARRLSCPGAHLAGVHAVRGFGDVDPLMADLAAGRRRIAVVGGGYIGLEAAAVLRKLGCEVVLIEAQDRVLARVAGIDLARFFEAEHRRCGVDLRLSAMVESLAGTAGRVAAVRLASGEEIACDAVVAGIGIVPAVGPLIAAGASGANGVDVDHYCRTSLEGIYAIGDCAAHANPFADGAVIRLESVQNAHDMANVVARAIMGEAQPYRALPWFWSNQYDLKLQTAGLSQGHDRRVLRGDPALRSFSVVYLANGRVIAVDAVNCTRDYAQGRRLVEARVELGPHDLARLAEADRPLKEFL